MTKQSPYPIGTPGVKWTAKDRADWLALQQIKRSYHDEVLAKLTPLNTRFEVQQYGALSYDRERYPLFVIKPRTLDIDKPSVLITGGVHGYETSGVQGALRFAETRMSDYLSEFNVIVAPCISPWGYETINRWNPNAVDPNRSFTDDTDSEEAAALMQFVADLDLVFLAHIDLHETTDTDNSEFRPALAARDAIEQKSWSIPDGFYLVGDTEKPMAEFQRAIINGVKDVTHIAPADGQGQLIGVDLAQPGVINYPTRALGLCAGMTDAVYKTTTEVYPDSPRVDAENCILAQVAAVTAGLDYLLSIG